MEKELVYKGESGEVLTNSLLVSQKFGKKHKHVLEAIRAIIRTAEDSSVVSMFCESSYLNEQNKRQPMYVMNRDGFVMLAMGFTGKQALNFKVDYIKAFNKMESFIRTSTAASEKAVAPHTPAEMLLMCAQQMVEQEKRMNLIESKQSEIEEKVSEIAIRTKTDLHYSTIVGFANRFGIKVPLERASTLGRVAKNLCRQYLLETGQIPDPRFGTVRTYPDSVLYETFEKYYPNVRFR